MSITQFYGTICQALFISTSRYTGANYWKVHRQPAKRLWQSTPYKKKLQKKTFESLKTPYGQTMNG